MSRLDIGNWRELVADDPIASGMTPPADTLHDSPRDHERQRELAAAETSVPTETAASVITSRRSFSFTSGGPARSSL